MEKDLKQALKKGMQRRSFVKNSAVAAGGIILSPLAANASGYFSSVDDTIKIALVGCGGRGTGATVQALSTKENVKLVAMADAFKDRLDKSYENILAQETYDATAKVDVKDETKFIGFEAYKEAIDMADVVILATPPGFRPIHFEYAVEQGKHIFMEKPVATDVPGIRKVLAAAEKAKQKKLNVVVGLQRHYQTSYRELMDRIHNGEIGDIVAAQAYWDGAGVWVREREEGQTEMEYQMRNWYYFNWLCGDHITEQHVHNIDVINWAKNAYPVKAQGMGGREVRNGKEFGEIFDHHFVEFEYADGTILSSQCRHIKGCMNRVSEAIQGTKGRATTQGGTIITDLKGKTIWKHRGKNDPNPYQQEHDELFAAIAAGEYKFADAENGAKSTMTSLLGRMATYSGLEITWDEAMKSDLSLMPATYAWDANPPIMPDQDGFYPVAIPGVTKVL
ncbi:Gfo/Idh/MocA family protein [Chondrinema litorale]|uniref:Gfo/Idh/MocA family protein n=1 Tax=Chondrinema litorale TaxID=2994555 RepID=UPI0025439909|nr:Gfo/Idh/MocA family oxidoreductase [Chondrinema litorale]UZR96035.1 Gfo/Idh/MocA family oxidoreductase [Chondrinema litorale]